MMAPDTTPGSVCGRLLAGRIYPGQRIAHRQHDERQQHVDHADQDAQFGADEAHRTVGRADANQRLVDQAVTAQQHHPAERAHDVAG
ncbi:hypothetical protein G6F55_014342 [Rhizopus delemar]|nr:hypothetical protein G6F55_014342 [Rhizopus delemar]